MDSSDGGVCEDNPGPIAATFHRLAGRGRGRLRTGHLVLFNHSERLRRFIGVGIRAGRTFLLQVTMETPKQTTNSENKADFHSQKDS